jgi:hypothetical protein
MSFEYVSNGDNTQGDNWIAAEGMITVDTPTRLNEFLISRSGGNASIRFNSLGGDMIAAISVRPEGSRVI